MKEDKILVETDIVWNFDTTQANFDKILFILRECVFEGDRGAVVTFDILFVNNKILRDVIEGIVIMLWPKALF